MVKYTVNVYKLVHNGIDIWHTGVAFHSRNEEFYFHITNRVESCEIGKHNNRRHKEIPLETDKTPDEVWGEFQDICHKYNRETTYDLLSCNCNTFTNEVMVTIFGKSIHKVYLNHFGLQQNLSECVGSSTIAELFKCFDGGVPIFDKALKHDVEKIPGGKGVTGSAKKLKKALKL